MSEFAQEDIKERDIVMVSGMILRVTECGNELCTATLLGTNEPYQFHYFSIEQIQRLEGGAYSIVNPKP